MGFVSSLVTGGLGALSGAGDLLGKGIQSFGGQTDFKAQQYGGLQSPVSNGQAQDAVQQQQDLVNALKAQGGVQNQSNVYNQQQGLANQLGAMAQGAGPNPALTQLNQTTGQNIANQAALMAGQRGAGANAGLIARQAAQQGGALQQQAVGQAATQRANQQLSAIGALQNQQNMLGNLANQQVGQQMGATQNQQTTLLNQINNQNQQGMENFYNPQGINAQVQQGNATRGQQAFQSVLQAGGSALTGMAEGGEVSSQMGTSAILKENYTGAKSKVGQHLLMAKGGQVPALVSPGEIYLNPEQAVAAKAGKMNPLAGEKIPGKAQVPGDKNSYANDTVPKTLEAGGVVLPRSVTQSEDPKGKADKFIAALKAKKGK